MSQTAERLRIAPSTVRLIPEAELPFERTPGGHRRYDPEVVEEYAQRKGIAPPKERASGAG